MKFIYYVLYLEFNKEVFMIVTNVSDYKEENGNQIIGNFTMEDCTIEFKGHNNILYCGENVCLKNCKLRFTGSNSLIYLDDNKMPIFLDARVGNDSVIYFGKDNYINRNFHIYATERKNVIIGNDCLFSFGNYLRTSDPHLIYDINGDRINEAKSIYIGDHVWIGQESLILKNTYIGSGAIIGGHSVVSNKIVSSNSIYGGNPVKKIRQNVFFLGDSAHDFTECDCIDFNHIDKVDFIYQLDDNTLSFNEIENDLCSSFTSLSKLDYIQENISSNNSKNRFYIS